MEAWEMFKHFDDMQVGQAPRTIFGVFYEKIRFLLQTVHVLLDQNIFSE